MRIPTAAARESLRLLAFYLPQFHPIEPMTLLWLLATRVPERESPPVEPVLESVRMHARCLCPIDEHHG